MLREIAKIIRENLPEGITQEEIKINLVQSFEDGTEYLMISIDKAVKNNVQ